MAGRFFWIPQSRATWSQGGTILFYFVMQEKAIYTIFIEILKCSVCGFDWLTSSGSMSLNSMFLPVQTIRCLLAGLSSSVSRNCQSCKEPRRWYGRPSCFTLAANNATQDTMCTSLIIRLGSPNSLYSTQIISNIFKLCPSSITFTRASANVLPSSLSGTMQVSS